MMEELIIKGEANMVLSHWKNIKQGAIQRYFYLIESQEEYATSVIIETLKNFPDDLVKTITSDRGKELDCNT